MTKRKTKQEPPHGAAELRIIGGHFRGSKLLYEPFVKGGDAVTRPMKERVRESIFNLISTEATNKQVVDLFAGTGALGLEALSRGATGATFIEKHIPTARVVEQNIAALGVQERCKLLMTSAFLWSKRDLPNLRDGQADCPWLVFCSPPYAFFVDRQDDVLQLIAVILEHAPPASILVVEADERFDFELLPGGVRKEKRGEGWDVRTYPPAVVGVWRT